MPETDRPTPRERVATLPAGVAIRGMARPNPGPDDADAGSPLGWVPALPLPVTPAPPPPVDLAAGEPGMGLSVGPWGPALRAALAARLPPAVRGGRWAPARPAVAGLLIVVLVAVGIAVALVVRGRPAAGSAPTYGHSAYVSTAPAALPTAAPASASSPAAAVVVDVAGHVRRPGVLRLGAGARVTDALHAAGGALPGTDTSDLDLARLLVDGEQLRVGLGPAPASAVGPVGGPVGGSGGAAGGAAGGAGSVAPSAPVDLNSATAEQLDALPGVGPVLAAKIIAWRQAHGRFARIEDLQEISGLGGKKYASLAPLVRVS